MYNLIIKKCGSQVTGLRTLKQLWYTGVRFTASATESHKEDVVLKTSALFISGKATSTQYKLLSPDLFPEILGQRKELLRKVLNLKMKGEMDLDKLEQDLLHYQQLKIKLDTCRKERKSLQEELKSNKNLEEQQRERIKLRIQELKDEIEATNSNIWSLEDSAILEFINLPNCGKLTVFEDEIISTVTSEKIRQTKDDIQTEEDDLLTYNQLISRYKLLEYSNNSHTAVYLYSHLAKTELSISMKVQNRLIQENFEQFSNPDFVTSIGVEGVDGDSLESNLLHLSAAQDFQDKESLNGMFLVGGASKFAFISYFARHIFLNPNILPLNLFSIGRQYKAVPEESIDLLHTQQSTVVNFMTLTKSREHMEENLPKLMDLLAQILSEFGTVRLIKKGAQSLERSEECRYSFQLLLPVSNKYIEVGHISVENDYYSRRLMFKQKQDDSYRNIYTMSGNIINITRTLPIVLENQQNSCISN